MSEKIVYRLPVHPDPVSDLIGLIDLIEFELLFADGQSVRECLSEAVDEIGRSEGKVSQVGLRALLDAIGRLEKIERLLSDNGFETDPKAARK